VGKEPALKANRQSLNNITGSNQKRQSTINLGGGVTTINYKLKNSLLQSINLMIQDIESVHDMITAQAIEHIHSNDVILTYGRSNILTSFFEVTSILF